jgi:hypothetical protein
MSTSCSQISDILAITADHDKSKQQKQDANNIDRQARPAEIEASGKKQVHSDTLQYNITNRDIIQ